MKPTRQCRANTFTLGRRAILPGCITHLVEHEIVRCELTLSRYILGLKICTSQNEHSAGPQVAHTLLRYSQVLRSWTQRQSETINETGSNGEWISPAWLLLSSLT